VIDNYCNRAFGSYVAGFGIVGGMGLAAVRTGPFAEMRFAVG
jgi:hypothetical protein